MRNSEDKALQAALTSTAVTEQPISTGLGIIGGNKGRETESVTFIYLFYLNFHFSTEVATLLRRPLYRQNAFIQQYFQDLPGARHHSRLWGFNGG